MDTLVGLTTTLEPQGGGYHQPQVTVYANYIRALSRVGLTPVLVTPAHDADQVARLVGLCSGLVLSGGEDVEPRRYGEDASPELGEVNPRRDDMEWAALDAALEREMPVFGICRGMQVLNVYFGGTLYQDLAAQRGHELKQHLQEAPWGQHQHHVTCEYGTRLQEILGDCTPMEINSFHHQAVKELAPNMRCSALAEDGLIEGIESEHHDWVVGVQWHPERHEAEAESTDPNLLVVSAFGDAVRAFAGR